MAWWAEKSRSRGEDINLQCHCVVVRIRSGYVKVKGLIQCYVHFRWTLDFRRCICWEKKIMGFGKTKLNLLNMHLCLASFFSLSFCLLLCLFWLFFAQNAFLFGFLFLSFLFLRKMPLEKGSVKDNFSKKKTWMTINKTFFSSLCL